MANKRDFGGAVFGHGAVKVEMIARQIGEYRAAKTNAAHAPLRQTVRRHFHRGVWHALIAPLRKLRLQRDRIGRRHATAGIFMIVGTAERIAERADHTARFAEQAQRLRKQLRAAGFAVGAGHADNTPSRRSADRKNDRRYG